MGQQLPPTQLRLLIEAARGLRPCDIALRGGYVINVFTGETFTGDVGIVGRHIAIVGDGEVDAHREIEVDGLFLTPGFIDSHMHLESSLLTPAEFARMVLPHGTTAVVVDPHEIANVAGPDGIRELMAASDGLPLKFYFMIPPAVPASELEQSGGRIEQADMARFAGSPNVVGIAEAMDYPGVIEAREDVLEKLTSLPDGVIDGHAPGLSGRDLQAYCAAGISSDHETTNAWEGEEKLRAGMYLMLREGSAARNLDDLIRLVSPQTVGRCLLVTDDLLPTDIEDHGHIDHLLRMAVRHGVTPIQAIRMAAINAAQRLGLDRVGAVAPGYVADIVGLEDLSEFMPAIVMAGGELAVSDGELVAEIRDHAFKAYTVRIPDLSVEDLAISAGTGMVRVIGATGGQIVTRLLEMEPTVLAGRVVSDTDKDVLKIVAVERHGRSGDVGLGLVNGFGLEAGAIAGSVAHDAHNLVAVGVSDSDILLALRRIAEMNGGLVAAAGGAILQELPLPIGGLMSAESGHSVASKLRRLEQAAHRLGCGMAHPFMTLSFMCLSVVPELKLTVSGLVDVEKSEVIPLFTGERAGIERAAAG